MDGAGVRVVRWLLGLAVVATLAWGGLWFVGSRGLSHALDTALAGPRAALRAESHAVRGFPNRFDITLTEPRLSEGAVDWAAPFVQVFALSYRPHHVIVVFPNEQRLEVGGLLALVTSDDARASVVMRPTSNLVLDRAVLVAQMPVVTLPGERLSADALRVALRPMADAAGSYEAVVEIESAFPDPAVLDLIDPDGHLPRRYDLLRLDARLRFDRPVDLDAFRGAPPRITEAVLTGARAAFDAIDLKAEGEVVINAQGRPEGAFTLSVTGWEALLPRLSAAGILTPEVRAWIDAAAPGLARDGQNGAIDIPLRLEAGQLRLGPLVLAELPAF